MRHEEILLQGILRWEGLDPLIDDIHGLFLEGMAADQIAYHVAQSIINQIVPLAKVVPEPLQSLMGGVLSEVNYEYMAKSLVESVVQEMVSSSRDRWNHDS
jgi:hypothetical protein